MDARSVRDIFKTVGGAAIPHPSFYVMSTYAMSGAADGPNLDNSREAKVGKLVDNCRVSWGEVRRVKKNELEVEYRPVTVEAGRLKLANPRSKAVRYNADVRPFASVKEGDVVSLHWDYACDILAPRQSRNIARYTDWDLRLVNGFLAARAGRVRR